MPAFRILFQVMIFAALLESGAGAVHAINERISGAVESRGRAPLGTGARALIGTAILTVCMFVAGAVRSEEHTSELQSLMRISYAGFCLKKKKINNKTYH